MATSSPLRGQKPVATARTRLFYTFKSFDATAARRCFVASSDFFEMAVWQHISTGPLPTGWLAR
jgi:putative SOS response-associated peptidase YedK